VTAHPLSGLRVLDLSRLLPGPFATLVLADLGADVVKVEDPEGGDTLRWMPPLAGKQSGYFHALNRNKRSMRLDLKKPEGAAAFRTLVHRADVVVESFRPGVMDRLGLGWEVLKRENPRLVLCSISGYGQDGPYRGRSGHDIDYCAVAGVLDQNGPPDRPLPLGVQAADIAGGAWPAVAGILAGLHRRTLTGAGSFVDISMTEGVLSMLAIQHGGAAARGRPPERGREMLNGGAGCYGVYRTKDGRFVALGALEPKFFARFCEAVARPELAERQLDGDGRGPRQELEEIFASRTRDEWERLGDEHDVCLAPVLEGDEPLRNPQNRARGSFLEIDTPWEGRRIPGLATPVRFDGVAAPRRPAPELGADTEAVLREAKFGDDEIEALRRAGAI
jgi:crotonobetainyl-CoA:carnitine CoA-transferase CaiB-like acyl-CoA transferase